MFFVHKRAIPIYSVYWYPANQTVQPSWLQQDYPDMSVSVMLPHTDGKNPTFEIHVLTVVNE